MGKGVGHLLPLLLQAPTTSQALVSRCFMFVVQLLSRVRLFATPWTIVHQAQLSMGFPRPGGGCSQGPSHMEGLQGDGCAQLLSAFSCKIKDGVITFR